MEIIRSMDAALDALALRIGSVDKRVAFACILLLTIPLFRPDILSHANQITFIDLSALVDLYKYWGLAAGMCTVLLFVLVGRRGIFAYLATAVIALVLTSTIMFDGNTGRWFVYWLPSAIMALLVASTCRHFYRELLLAVLLVTFVMEAVNFASVLLFPEGMWTTDKVAEGGNYFFDHRNNAYKLLIPMILCSFLLDRLNGKRIGVRTVLLMLLSFAQVVLALSVTSTVALTLFILFLLIVQLKCARGFLNGINFLFASILTSLLVVGLRIQDMFGFFVEGVLRKEVTFTGRTYIWDKTFELFRGVRHTLFGYGVSGYKHLSINGQPYPHAHNEFLDLWLNGGLAALIIFLCALGVLAWSLFKMRHNWEIAVITAAIGAYYVIGLAEPIICSSFLFVAALGFYRSRYLVAAGSDGTWIDSGSPGH